MPWELFYSFQSACQSETKPREKVKNFVLQTHRQRTPFVNKNLLCSKYNNNNENAEYTFIS